MHILGIFAHPDDAEIWAGGTLVKYKISGHRIFVVTFSTDDAERIAEAKLGADILGSQLKIISGFTNDEDNVDSQSITSYVHETNPDIIISHWGDDTHPQHRSVFEAVNKCIIKYRIKTGRPQALYSCDTYNSVGLKGPFHPSCYIDVSDTWERKLEAIDAHKSQTPEMWKEMISKQSRLHGARIGRDYAEAFVEVPILGQFKPRESFF